MLVKTIFLLLLIVLLGILSSFSNETNPVEAIVQKFKTWHQVHPQEKVYLHISKSLFLPEDTMYCKVYLVNADGNIPSATSSIVYVDVIDNNKRVLKTTLVPLSDGTGWCSVAIHNWKAGDYQIRAYTNWMRNSDDDFFFKKSITVSDGLRQTEKVLEPHPFHQTVFFPEGGQLVTGLPAHVAFKAVGSNGLGIGTSGSIRDETGKEVASFRSGFAGMGSFLFTPLLQHLYYAIVKYEDGFKEKVALPNTEANGYALSIDNTDKNDVNITVLSGMAASNVMLIGQSSGQELYSANLQLMNGTATTKFSNKKFPTGIAQFTLFDSKSIPVAERLVFINHQDTLHIETTLEKSSAKREKVKLKLHVTDDLDEPVTGSFSLAVTEASTAPYDAITDGDIRSNLLLTADLKGYIENPNYYFTGVDSIKIRDLDNLLLTQGWRRFRWSEVLTDTQLTSRYTAETSLSLTGKVRTENSKALSDAKVNLLSKSGTSFLFRTTTDSAGNFRFNDLLITGEASFALQATKQDGSKNVIISVDSISPPPVNNSEAMNRLLTVKSNPFLMYASANEKRWEDLKKYGLVKSDIPTLKEVTVKSEKLSKVQQAVAPSYNLNGPGNADQVLTYDDLFNCHELSRCLPGKIVGVTFKTIVDPGSGGIQTFAYSNSGFGVPMLINIDGVDVPAGQSSIDNIPAGDIQSIEVLRSGGYLNVYGTRASGGVLVVTTKKGDLDYNHLNNNSANKNVLLTTRQGYAVRREFYLPQYDLTSNTTEPDLRSTLYWKPDVITDEDGNATVEWYNADVTGTFNIVVQGISNNGRMGNVHLSYEVK